MKNVKEIFSCNEQYPNSTNIVSFDNSLRVIVIVMLREVLNTVFTNWDC